MRYILGVNFFHVGGVGVSDLALFAFLPGAMQIPRRAVCPSNGNREFSLMPTALFKISRDGSGRTYVEEISS